LNINAPNKISQTKTCTKIKIKNIKTVKNMMNNMELRTTQKNKRREGTYLLKNLGSRYQMMVLPSFCLNFCGGLWKLNGSGGQGCLQWSHGFLEGAL